MFRNVCMCISPDRQPASCICLLQDSCHSRKRIVVGIADAHVHKVELATGIIVALVVSFPGKVKPLRMSELVT